MEPTKIEDGEPAGKLSKDETEQLVQEADKRLDHVIDAWHNNHEDARDDINFRDGNQIPEEVRRAREGRPMMVFNQMETYIGQITGDGRQNRFSIACNPVDLAFGDQEKIPNVAGGNDYALSEVYEGIIRQIEYQSSAETAYDTALDHAAGNGFGFWRILTKYNTDEGFDKDIYIARIPNPLACAIDLTDPGLVGEGSDYGFIWGWMDSDTFKRRYHREPNPDRVSHVGISRSRWWDGDKTRVSEYFRRVGTRNRIVLLESGERIRLGTDKKLWAEHERYIASQGGRIRETRNVESIKVEHYLLNGGEILKGPVEFPAKHIPIIMCAGRELNKDGEYKYRSVIRYAKDAQRNYNYRRNTVAERLALGAMAPWVGDKRAFAGFEMLWKDANVRPMGYLPFNSMSGTIAPPSRVPPPEIPAGDVQDAQASEMDMKMTTGIFEAALGQKSNEKSGIALERRKAQTTTGTFSYHDNLQKGVEHTAKILLEMIPRVIDNERVQRIRNTKGETDQVRINVEDPYTGEKLYDIGSAKFDVTVKAGGNYQTQREEFTDVMAQVINQNKEALMLIGDLFFENLDHPGAKEVAKRFRAMLPDQIKQAERAEQAGEDPNMMEPITQEQVQAQVAQAVQQALQGIEAQKLQIEREKVRAGIRQKDRELDLKGLEMVQKENENEGKAATDNQAQIQELVDKIVADVFAKLPGFPREAAGNESREHEQENELPPITVNVPVTIDNKPSGNRTAVARPQPDGSYLMESVETQ